MKERVENICVRTFTIASCPEKVYQRFVKFCKENARNVRFYQDKQTNQMKQKEEIIYHVGLRLLLDAFEADAKNVMLFEKIKQLETKITLLEQQINKSQNKKEIKTFGNSGGAKE